MSTASLTYLRDYLTSTLTPSNMMWLSTQLEEYAEKMEMPLVGPHSMEEMNAMLDEAERDFEAGLGIDDEDLWKEDEEEYERELAEEQKLQLEAV